jgi:hypothetical protein
MKSMTEKIVSLIEKSFSYIKLRGKQVKVQTPGLLKKKKKKLWINDQTVNS